MDLKKYLDSHPLFVIIGLGVAIATSTGGAVTFLLDRANDTEMAQLETAHAIEVSTLRTRLASIERKLGDNEDFFDLSRLIIPTSAIKTLGGEFRTIGNDGRDQFFISEPDMSGWKYTLTSELELLRESLAFGAESPMELDAIAAALERKNLHLWRNNSSIKFSPPMTPDDVDNSVTFTLFPYVAVQMLRASDLTAAASQFHKAMASASDLDDLSNRLDDLLKTLDTITADSKPSPDEDRPILLDSDRDQQLVAAPNTTAGEAKLKLESSLSELFRGDLATIILAAQSNQWAQMPTIFPGTKTDLQTVQKKGNVLYMQASTRFSDVQRLDDGTRSSVVLDQEFFIVTNADAVFIVKIQIPSIDGRSDSFSWVSQWLSGFRIPLGLT